MTAEEQHANVRAMLYNTTEMNDQFNPQKDTHLESIASPNKLLRFEVEE